MHTISDGIQAIETPDIDFVIDVQTHGFLEEPGKCRMGWEARQKYTRRIGQNYRRVDGTIFPRFKRKKCLNAHTVVIGKKTRE